ncbi:MAG: hypothetical protein HYW85_06855, partial [Deltaproteobacteria bacterium]|nr:hypothetical protein [Deltaproteobacteria bacterium]
MTLKKIQDLKTKKELIQAIDAELPTSVEDVRKAHVLSWKVAKKSSSEFSTQIDAYNFAGNPSAVPILSNLNTLISHNPMTKNQIDLLMASGQVASLEQAVLIVKKNLETVEMIVEQQKNEDEIRTTYLEIRRGSVGVSQILAAFDPHIQNTFNRVVNPLIDMSQSYSALKVASTGGFKLDLTTLSACATGIGAIFALADFFITASQPSEMEILMEHLNGQFEKLHERFDKL